MPKKIICLIAAVALIAAAFVLPGFAAVDDDITTDGSNFIYSPYPSANLIPFPYVGPANSSSAAYFSVDDYSVITVRASGTARATYNVFTGSVPAGTYTFSVDVLSGTYDTSKVTLYVQVEATYYTVYASSARTLTFNDATNITIAISTLAVDGEIDCSLRPMMNVGSVAYPFSPYLPYLMNGSKQEGYTEGTEAGRQEGYQQGYTEGEAAGTIAGTTEGYKNGYIAGIDAAIAPVSFFTLPLTIPQITYNVSATDENLWVYDVPLSSYAFIDGALNAFYYVDYVIDYWNEMQPNNRAIYASVRIHFESSTPFMPVEGVAFTSSRELNYIRLEYQNEDGSYGGRDSLTKTYNTLTGLYEYSFATVQEGRYYNAVTVATVSVAAADDQPILVKSLGVRSPGYQGAYEKGYIDGAEKGLGEAGKQYYDQGYTQGFKEGKADGLSIAEQGDWKDLVFAVVEAPVSAFQGLFNFEILGLDMRAAVGSILTLCVVLIVFKKVVL